jgi:hypothetical protein
MKDGSVDYFHVYLSNNGDTYRWAFETLIKKVSLNGIIVLEVGTPKRDNFDWMVSYHEVR